MPPAPLTSYRFRSRARIPLEAENDGAAMESVKSIFGKDADLNLLQVWNGEKWGPVMQEC
ncbi:MAG: hypothetical protein EOP84_30675 [Verrucomicrobiaceae bacterium]|nr:MAG: hypothetical protein EOP84_30675 [Verrucomicrobiaceae bacterium]